MFCQTKLNVECSQCKKFFLHFPCLLNRTKAKNPPKICKECLNIRQTDKNSKISSKQIKKETNSKKSQSLEREKKKEVEEILPKTSPLLSEGYSSNACENTSEVKDESYENNEDSPKKIKQFNSASYVKNIY